MFARNISVALVSASLVAVPVQRAQASDAAAVLGGLIVGGIIVNEVNKNNQRKRAAQQRQTTTNSSAYSAQRAQNRQVQTALNYFGYNVGTVDGSIGRNTRNGIARYQSDMGFHADGRLDDYERDFLLNSQQRAEASGYVAPYNQILATQGRGGLLRTFRDEQLGIAPQTAAVAPTPAPVPAPVPATKTVSAPKTQSAELPQFNIQSSGKSASTVCNEINVLTAANGGVTSAAQITDAEFALNEQFCLARTHAMAEAAAIEANIPDLTSAQIEAQCQGLAQAVAPHITSIATARPDEVINETSSFMQSSGQPMDRLIAGGKVCLGVGYRTDDSETALASAVLLASGGELGYAEMVSHQLREGFGTARTSPEKAGEWMTLAINGMSSGNPMVLGQSPDRIAVLTAAQTAGGQSASALPVFPSSD